MEDLVNKSLARRTVKYEDALGTFYSIHNLQLTYLQEQAQNLEALHKKLVNQYWKLYKGKEKCENGFLTLEMLTYLSIPLYLPSLLKYLFTYLPTYLHTYLHTYLLTYLPTYLLVPT